MTGGSDVLGRHAWRCRRGGARRPRARVRASPTSGGWSWPQARPLVGALRRLVAGRPRAARGGLEARDVGRDLHASRGSPRALALRAGWSGDRLRLARRAAAAAAASPSPTGYGDGFLSRALAPGALLRRAPLRALDLARGGPDGDALSLRARRARARERLPVARARGLDRAVPARPAARAHVVLALRAAGGVAERDHRRARAVRARRASPAGPALAPAGARPPTRRTSCAATPRARSAGPAYVLGNVELRFPLACARARPLHLAASSSAARTARCSWTSATRSTCPASCPSPATRSRRTSCASRRGAELRLEVVLGYYLRTDVRLGVARPLGALLGRGRAADLDAGLDLAGAALYVTIGPSF